MNPRVVRSGFTIRPALRTTTELHANDDGGFDMLLAVADVPPGCYTLTIRDPIGNSWQQPFCVEADPDDANASRPETTN